MKNVEILSPKAARVLSNESCKQILDIIAEQKISASELSERLDMSASKVHYNLKQLKGAGLIKANTYKYSKKGKEMLYYETVNKVMIFSANHQTLRQFLQTIIPTTVLFIAGLIYLFPKEEEIVPMAQVSMRAVAYDSAPQEVIIHNTISPFVTTSLIILGVISLYFFGYTIYLRRHHKTLK